MKLTTVTGLLLILVPLAFNITFLLLGKAFDYPGILRKPTDTILRQFKAGGASLRRLWYAFMFSAVLFTPVPVMVQQVFQPRRALVPCDRYSDRCFGGGCSVSWVDPLALFLSPRWRTCIPNPKPPRPPRDAVEVVFQAFHRYVGVAIGEHLGYIFTSVWTFLLCMAIIGTHLVSPILGWIGILPAIGVFVGVFEETGFKSAGAINAISYLLWSVWMIAFGVALLLR